MEQISSILQPFYHSWIGSDGFAHPAANHPIDADIGVESEPEANSLPFAVIVLVFDDDIVRQADFAAGGKGPCRRFGFAGLHVCAPFGGIGALLRLGGQGCRSIWLGVGNGGGSRRITRWVW